MIPMLPSMSAESIKAYVEAREMWLVVNVEVPLYDVVQGPEGYSTARSIGYAVMPDAVHVHPDRLIEFHLRTLASVMILACVHGWRSNKFA